MEWTNVEKEHSMGMLPIMHAGAIPAVVELMQEMWGLLTEEQKKQVMAMRIDIITQMLETEINNQERINEVKKKAIANMRKVRQEMMK